MDQTRPKMSAECDLRATVAHHLDWLVVEEEVDLNFLLRYVSG